jgi:hypothetical protein
MSTPHVTILYVKVTNMATLRNFEFLSYIFNAVETCDNENCVQQHITATYISINLQFVPTCPCRMNHFKENRNHNFFPQFALLKGKVVPVLN